MWQNMSLTQVAPDSSSSAPLSMAPTRAISLVRWRPTGATSRSPHSNRVRSSPMPQISASDRWVWPLTSPGSTTPWSSPTTSAPGNRLGHLGEGPDGQDLAAGEGDRPAGQVAGRPHGQDMAAAHHRGRAHCCWRARRVSWCQGMTRRSTRPTRKNREMPMSDSTSTAPNSSVVASWLLRASIR